MSEFRTKIAATVLRYVGRFKPLAGRLSASIFILLIIVLACSWAPVALADVDAAADGYGAPAAEMPSDPPQPEDDGSVPVSDELLSGPGSAAPLPGEKDAAVGAPGQNSPATADAPPVYTIPHNPALIEEGEALAAVEEFKLILECNYGDPGTFWEDADDYLLRLLSIRYLMSNAGPGTAYDVTITEAIATEGVSAWSPLPELGDIAAGGSVAFILKWQVPESVQKFETKLSACASCEQYIIDPEDKDPDPDPDPTPALEPLSRPLTASAQRSLPLTGMGMDGLLFAVIASAGAFAAVMAFRHRTAAAQPPQDR